MEYEMRTYNPSTNHWEQPFDLETKAYHWVRLRAVAGEDPSTVRIDCCGWRVHWDQYGNRQSDFGWELDHIKPRELGGLSTNDNLQALHWKNNVSKGANYPNWYCAVG